MSPSGGLKTVQRPPPLACGSLSPVGLAGLLDRDIYQGELGRRTGLQMRETLQGYYREMPQSLRGIAS